MRTLICISAILVLISSFSCDSPTKTNQLKVVKREHVLDLSTLTITIPSSWSYINDDTLPKAGDMTVKYMVRTSSTDTIHIWHGNSTWGFFEEDSNYTKTKDSLGSLSAWRVRPMKEAEGYLQFYVDSVGTFKPISKYGLSVFVRKPKPAMEDTFWRVVHTIKMRPF